MQLLVYRHLLHHKSITHNRITSSNSVLISHSLYRHQIEKRIRTLPEIDGLSKETVVTSWMSKYDFIMKGESFYPNPLS